MKHKYESKVNVPDGVTCSFSNGMLNCSKGNANLSRKFVSKGLDVSVAGKEIISGCARANKKDIANIHSQVAHVRNIFLGLHEKFVYELEICNVHFPMTLKGGILLLTLLPMMILLDILKDTLLIPMVG